VNTGSWCGAFAKHTAADKGVRLRTQSQDLGTADPCTSASRLCRQKRKSRKSELSNITAPLPLTGGGQKESKTSRVALISVEMVKLRD